MHRQEPALCHGESTATARVVIVRGAVGGHKQIVAVPAAVEVNRNHGTVQRAAAGESEWGQRAGDGSGGGCANSEVQYRSSGMFFACEAGHDVLLCPASLRV